MSFVCLFDFSFFCRKFCLVNVEREIEMNDQMASRGADLVVRGENILTHW